ncbi:serine protease; identified by sequence similarity; putative; ORF located using Blastx/Glimmer [hydrothermal vent metagenome]|uniref:Serine protease identified by sequence similarity putative ORF located using Blastx/Glimmer n=1 Tax=hydrothermal vent metagenome TaxID=652676 RepID=A0A1W1BHH4_9ZZZZ
MIKIILTVLLSTLSLTASLQQEDITKQAIVKIYTVSKVLNYQEPWNSSTRSSTGSGAIISGHRILTNAHVVENHTFIEVERYGQRKRYIAKVKFVSHQADLALLEVKDEAFFKGVTPLQFGKLPNIEQKIVVYGYPMGGSTLSATIGVVSRIEHHRYAHSGESFLAIQVDAAVNPGNSGGPALSNGKIIGVVMQVIRRSQNIGYLVPVIMVKHFLKDVKDGKCDGFADLGLTTQKMENPALRHYYQLDENETGKLIAEIVYNSSLNGVARKGDILTAIDGHKIENDGTIAFRPHEYTDFNYYVDRYQMFQTVKLDIVRQGKKMQINADLTHTADDILLVKTTRYDVMPTYYIYGGYVFSPLTRNLLLSTNRNRLALSYFATQWPTKKKKEVVVLLKVLASDISRGNNNVGMWPIEKLNGETFDSFQTFFERLRTDQGKYIILEDKDGVRIVIDREDAQKKQADILQKYNIEYDRSIDLRNETK